MPYVERDGDKIVALHKHPTEAAKEQISIKDKELMPFLLEGSQLGDEEHQWLRSDMEMARVIEDLVVILMSKDIINITDFPTAVIEKLRLRQGVRGQLSQVEDIFGPDDSDDS